MRKFLKHNVFSIRVKIVAHDSYLYASAYTSHFYNKTDTTVFTLTLSRKRERKVENRNNYLLIV